MISVSRDKYYSSPANFFSIFRYTSIIVFVMYHQYFHVSLSNNSKKNVNHYKHINWAPILCQYRIVWIHPIL